MKIVFEGFYGFQNSGDDAFVEISNWGARKYWNCHNNVFLGAELPETSLPINAKQLFPKLKGMDRFNLVGHLTNSNYFISSGGSTFQELPFHSNKAIASQFQKKKKNLILGGIGVSIGPFKNSEKENEVFKYVKQLGFLALRDKRSYDLVNSWNLNFKPVRAFDLAALLPQVYQIPSKTQQKEQKTVGISICYYERFVGGDLSREAKRVDFFKKLVKLLSAEKNIHFKVFIFNGDAKMGDCKATEELMQDIDASRFTIFPYSRNLQKTWKEIAACDVVISTRLHASIFACYANVPFFLIEYHKKCSDFLKDVGQLGEYRFFDAEIDAKVAYSKVIEVLNSGFVQPENWKETISLAEKNFTETLG